MLYRNNGRTAGPRAKRPRTLPHTTPLHLPLPSLLPESRKKGPARRTEPPTPAPNPAVPWVRVIVDEAYPIPTTLLQSPEPLAARKGRNGRILRSYLHVPRFLAPLTAPFSSQAHS